MAEAVPLYEHILLESHSVINFDVHKIVEHSLVYMNKIPKELSQTNGETSTTLEVVDISSVEIHELPRALHINQTVILLKYYSYKNKIKGQITAGSTTMGATGEYLFSTG